jgi:tetratricopeptide (TPR) repeat protein
VNDQTNRFQISHILLLVASFVFLAFLLYWSSIDNPIIFDDKNIKKNTLSSFLESNQVLNIRWLSSLTFSFIYEIFGDNWMWQRIFNIVLHSAVSLVLFLFLDRLFSVTLGSAHSKWLAFLGSIFFLVHPVSVYAVAYLIQRSIVMATFFSLLSLLLLLEGSQRKSVPWYIASVFAYGFALLSKEHAVCLPLVGVILMVLVHGYSRPVLLRSAVVLGITTLIGAFAAYSRRDVIGLPYEPFTNELLIHLRTATDSFNPDQLYPLSIINQGYLYFRYLFVWIIPSPDWMSIDLRPPFPTKLFNWPQCIGFLAWAVYPFIGMWLILKRGCYGLLGFALLFPWLLALTEFVTIRFQEPLVLYRSYLWMSGLPVALPVLVNSLPAVWRLAIPALICLILIIPQQNRVRSFSDAFILWDDAVRKNKNDLAPWVERPYVQRGLIHMNNRRYEEAMQDFERAGNINSFSPEVYLGRGTVMLRTGNLQFALKNVDQSIELDPNYASAYEKRCVIKMLLDDKIGALADCEKSIELDPDSIDAHINLGVVNRESGRIDDAAVSYQRALEIDPDDSSAHYNYGALLLYMGKGQEAQQHFKQACERGISDACEFIQ